MAIGTFGSVVFETSDAKILTPSGIQRTVGSRWTTHELISGKPRTQHLGADLQKTSFNISLKSTHGVKPKAMLETLESMAEGSEAYPLIIGGRPVGNCNWRLTSMSESWEEMYNQGELASASVGLTLEEYV